MQTRQKLRAISWVALAVSVVWCGFIFYAYRDGPYVSFGKALWDSTPFFLFFASVVALIKWPSRE